MRLWRGSLVPPCLAYVSSISRILHKSCNLCTDSSAIKSIKGRIIGLWNSCHGVSSCLDMLVKSLCQLAWYCPSAVFKSDIELRLHMTHGSKMTEEQRALWTMSASIMSEFNIAFQLLKISAKITSCSPSHRALRWEISWMAELQKTMSTCMNMSP